MPDLPIWLQSLVSPTAHIAAVVICITVRGCLLLFVVHLLGWICCSLFILVIISMLVFCCFGFIVLILFGLVGFVGFCCLIVVLRYQSTVCLCMLWVCLNLTVVDCYLRSVDCVMIIFCLVIYFLIIFCCTNFSSLRWSA